MQIIAGLNKLLTPPLTADDRFRFLQTWGLGEFQFLFGELTPDLVLREVLFRGQASQPSLAHLRIDEWRAMRSSDFSPCLERRFTSPLTPEDPPLETSLWEDTFPYPLNRLPTAVSPIHSNFSVSPPSFLEAASRACTAFSRLEQNLAGNEVGILWLCRGSSRFPLLIHSVRRKRLRVGTGEFLMAIGESFEQGQLSTETLFSQFGTAVGFVQVTLKEQSEPDLPFAPFLQMANAIHSSLSDPGCGLVVRPGDPHEKGDFRL